MPLSRPLAPWPGIIALLVAPATAWPQEPPAAPPGNVRFPTGTIRFPTEPIAERLRTSSNELHFRLTADILFDFDKADLRPQAEAVLRDLAAQIRERFRQRAAIRVEGHTDSIGTDAYNDALSLRRADAVKRWLTRPPAGFPAAAVQTSGMGRRQPIAPNGNPDGSDNPVGRQQNRRVEIIATAGGQDRRR